MTTMGLVDETRDRRDSWTSRLEEQRVCEREYDHEHEERNAARIAEEIERNRSMVGKFPRREKNR